MPHPIDVTNKFAAMAGATEADSVDEETEEGAAKRAPSKLSPTGLYSGGRCGCPHAEDRNGNRVICSLHEFRKISQRCLREDRKSQMATMAYPEPTS